MKIGILTFQNAHNWGAILQLYALKTYLENQGYNVKVINYINPFIEKNYSKKIKIDLKAKNIKSFLREIKKTINKIYTGKQRIEKWNLFNSFIQNEILNNDDKVYKKEDIEKLDLDYIICGSDQIWNPFLTGGLDEVYFGTNNKKAKKISYAASMGIKELPNDEEVKFKNYIKNLNYISVRENTLKKYIEQFTDKEVYKVLDPTLLIDKSEYLKIEKKIDLKNYLLLYTLISNKKLLKIAKKIAKQLNLQIIELCYDKNINNFHHRQIANVGPREFISLIHNASFIITNSFHGTVFSIILNKQFYTIPNKGVNSRIDEILKITGLQDRQIENIDEIDLSKKIDFNLSEEKLKKEQLKSKQFLKQFLI